MNSNAWMTETTELLEGWQRRKDAVEDRIAELEDELAELGDNIASGYALMRAYIEKHNVTLTSTEEIQSGYFANKSYPDILVEIAQQNQGYLKVADAVEIMLRAHVATDRRAIQANVYSALRRKKKQFIKMAPGEYRYVNHARKDAGKPSGLRQAVKELKEKNPQMTKNEVLNYLFESGFDFKGKKPMNAVNITWAYLGYSKEGKQPSLLGIDAHRLAMLGIRDKQKNKN